MTTIQKIRDIFSIGNQFSEVFVAFNVINMDDTGGIATKIRRAALPAATGLG
ncbi:MAG: hypothetical protein AABZ77_09715 [Chloroflexota bacterium]